MLFRTVAPAAEPVTLAEAKAHLRLTTTAEDELITGLIRAARQEVEARNGTALIDQHWRLVLDRWPRSGLVPLKRHPVRELIAVTVFGEEGEATLIDPAAVETDLDSRPARLLFTNPLPPARRMNGIEIDFRAGFGEAGTDVPDLLKRAVLLLVGHWYEFRASFDASDQPVSLPSGFERLIAPWQSLRI